MRRILFVDDEVRILEGLRRMLHPLRHDWEMVFTSSAEEALEILAARSADVVLTDIRMPGMDGAELLNTVMQRHPETVRIALSGHADHAITLKTVKIAHQYLSKPCEAEALKNTLRRAFGLRDLLSDAALRALVCRVSTLPSVPAVYQELTRVLEDPECSARDAARIIEQDTGMTAKLLQLVNSAFFGVRQRVTTPAQAVLYLGVDTVKALALSAGVFSQFKSCVSRFSITSLNAHSTATGVRAQALLSQRGASMEAINHALTAGLVHDVGKLVLVTSLPAKYDETIGLAQARSMTVWEAEREVFGCTHAEVGGYLLWLWGLPDPIVEAAAFHHEPSRSPSRDLGPLSAVHLANILAHQPNAIAGTAPQPDHEYLCAVGLESELSEKVTTTKK
jgi:HD-like signal output (HDOD) protein